MGRDEEYLSISDFSRLTGIKRKNLIFYDESGLLPPDRVGANGYRYYAASQVRTAYIIRAFREMGFALKDIKDILQHRYPERVLDLFADQERALAAEMDRLRGSLAMMRVYRDLIEAGRRVDDDRVELLEQGRQPAFFGPVIEDGEGSGLYENLAAFYEAIEPLGIRAGHPVGIEISRESMEAGEWGMPHRLYCLAANGDEGKEAGLYVVAHGKGDTYDRGYRKLYTAVRNFMDVNRLRPAGCAYEARLVDELAASDDEDCVLRLEVRVEKR